MIISNLSTLRIFFQPSYSPSEDPAKLNIHCKPIGLLTKCLIELLVDSYLEAPGALYKSLVQVFDLAGSHRVTPCLSFDFQVAEKTVALTCRRIWKVKDDDFNLSMKLIVTKHLRLDDALAKIRSVHFFISSVTGITSNAIQSSATKAGKCKRKGENEDEGISQQKFQSIDNDNNKVLFDHGVTYFIVYTPSNLCNQDTIFELFHKNEMEATVDKIRTHCIKVYDDENKSMRQQLLKKLELVVNNHKCPAIVKILRESNKFCFHRSLAETDYDENELFLTKLPEYGENDLSDKPCHIFVVNTGQFLSKLQSVCNELNNDGLQIHLKGNLEGSNDDPVSVYFEPTSGVFRGIEKLANSMKALGHALYKGDLYARITIHLCLHDGH